MMLRKRAIENMCTVRCLIMTPARLMNDNEQQLWKQLQQKIGRRQSNICSFFFLFSTAVKSLKRESVRGIISKDVNASLSTLFEKNRQDVIFIMQFCCQLHVGIKDITCSATLLWLDECGFQHCYRSFFLSSTDRSAMLPATVFLVLIRLVCSRPICATLAPPPDLLLL